MWTATYGKAERRGYMLHAAFTLTSDSGEVINDTTFADDLTPERLAQVVEQRIKSLEARDAAFDVLKNLEGSPVELPRDKVLTREEQDKRDAQLAADAFFVALAEYNAARVSLEKGLVTQAAVDAKAVAVKQTYLPEYEKDVRFR